VGSQLQLSGKTYRLIGVLPSSFRLPLSEVDVLVPFEVHYPEGGVGVYGVVSYQVRRRTRELGVRMALGASPGGVLALVMGEVARIAVPAVAMGLRRPPPGVTLFPGPQKIKKSFFRVQIRTVSARGSDSGR
jgi:hypothetical protein